MKNLETEYKNQISHEAPDLWDRIEAGIDRIEAEKATAPATAISDTPTAPVNTDLTNNDQIYNDQINNTSVSKTQIRRFNSRKVIYTIGKYSAVAVALIAVFLTVNVIRNGIGRDSATSPSANTAQSPRGNASNGKHSDAAAEATYSPAAEAADASEYVNEASEATSPATEDVRGDEADDALKAPDSDSEFTFEYLGGNQKWHDKLLERLGDLGFTDISDLELEKFNPTKSSNIYNATFYYEEIDEKCIVYFAMFVGENSDDIEILDIAPVSDPQNYLYKISSDDD